MVSFDLRETLIPFSLLQITNLFREMEPGDEMEIIAGTDPDEAAMIKDVLRILPHTNYDLIARETVIHDGPLTRLRLRKKKNQTPKTRKEPHHV